MIAKTTWVLTCLLVFGAGCSATVVRSTVPENAEAEPAEEEGPAAEPAAAEPALDESWEGEGQATTASDAANPKPSAGSGVAEGETRTMPKIQQIVKDNREKVRACYEAVLKELPSLKGDLVVHFVIDPEGKVKKAEHNLEQSTIKNKQVADCAIAEIKKLKFPPSSKGMETTVNYPFNLNP